MHTVEEAKKKWCPQKGQSTCARDEDYNRCEADCCAWWVWTDKEERICGKAFPAKGRCGMVKP